MSNTTFVDATTTVPGTPVVSAWLNDVNDAVYEILGDGTNIPATKAAARTNLGLGTIATQNSNSVAITGGSITGITDLAIADGGTGASTAAAALSNLGIGPLGFMAHNNTVAQSIPNNAITQLTFSTEQFDLGAAFTASAWTPPTGRLVEIGGSVQFGIAAPSRVFISIYKNGAEFKRGVDIIAPAGVVSVTVNAIDNPSGTDVYTLQVYQFTGGAVNTDGRPVVTYFYGSRL